MRQHPFPDKRPPSRRKTALQESALQFPLSAIVIFFAVFILLSFPGKAAPAERISLYQINSILTSLEEKLISFEKRVAQMEKFNQAIRKSQADLGVKMDGLLTGMEVLKAKFEEDSYYFEKISQDAKSFKEGYLFRSLYMEKQIEDVKKKLDLLKETIAARPCLPSPLPAKESLLPVPSTIRERLPGEKNLPAGKENQSFGLLDEKAIYDNGVTKFQQGNTKEASLEFEKLLELYPQSVYADNAQFRIGECFFKEKRYDEAIIAYQKVIKKYPKGNKVPDAFLKQGLAFCKRGDEQDCAIVLEEVIRRYPQSHQAGIAKKKLEKLK